MTETLDFDQFWDSQITPATKVKVFGEWVTVDLDLSLKEITKYSSEVDLDNPKQVSEIAIRLYGQEVFDQWLEKSMKPKALTLLVMWAMLRIQGLNLTFEEVDAMIGTVAGKAMRSALSDQNGEPSRLISNDSTGSGKRRLKGLPQDDSTSSSDTSPPIPSL